jgi:hypothetical protein
MFHGRFVPNPKRACLPTVAPLKCGDTQPVYSRILDPERQIALVTAMFNAALVFERTAPTTHPPRCPSPASRKSYRRYGLKSYSTHIEVTALAFCG